MKTLKFIFKSLLWSMCTFVFVLTSISCFAQNWEVVYDSIPSIGRQVIMTYDSCYLVTSTNNPFDPGISLKIDQQGNVLWVVPNGGLSVQQTFDSGFIIAGWMEQQFALLEKLDKNGNLLWTKTYGGNSQFEFHSVIQTSDTCFVATGFTHGYADSTLYVVKTDSLGNLKWQRTFQCLNVGSGPVWNVIETNNQYYILGSYYFPVGTQCLFIAKLNNNGALIWRRDYQPGYYGHSMAMTSDSSFIIAGRNSLIKINSNGDTIWCKNYNSNWDFYSVDVTDGQGFIIAGNEYNGTNDECLLVRTDPSGNIVWNHTYPTGYNNGMNFFSSVKNVPDNGFIACGSSSYNDTIKVRVIRTDADGIITSISEFALENTGLTVYPNPVTGRISLQFPKQFGQIKTLEIYNRIGQLLLKKTNDFSAVDLVDLSSGLYIVVMTNANNQRLTSRIIKE